MYQALYRKWRPRDFNDVVGQEHITVTLKNEVSTGKFSHAYLFTGSRGTGKTTCSKIIAKAVNCENPQDGNPCNKCSACTGIEDGSVLDVSEIDAASNNGVDNIRQLREEAYFLPASVKYRVYILDECHMLSAGAVNALLKILEEPPEHVIFILATTEVHKVLPTILSRCQRFDFKRIKPRTIADRILHVCSAEEIAVTDSAAMLIARLSDGGMRDALSLLDLCRSYQSEITDETVTRAAGLTDQSHLFRMVAAVKEANPAQALAQVDALSENSVDFSRLCEQLVRHFRNLMVIKTVKDPDGLITDMPDQIDQMREQANDIKLGRIMYALDILQETMGKMSRTAFKRTEFEMALVRLCDKTLGQGLEGAFERIEKLEKAIRTGAIQSQAVADGGSHAPAASAMPQETPPLAENSGDLVIRQPVSEPEKPAVQKKAGVTEVVPFSEWARVLSVLQKQNGALYGAMVDSRAFISGEMVLIDCKNEMFLTLLRTSIAAKESLRDAILEITGQKYNLGPYNPSKHVQKAAGDVQQDPLSEMLKKAGDLGVQVELT